MKTITRERKTQMNRILASILAAVLTLSTGCSKTPVTSDDVISSAEQIISPETAETTDEQTQQSGFTVSGTKLLDANGNEFIMRGINHPHSWFTAEDDTALEAIAATGANTVRIVCGSGQQYTKDSVESLNKVTDKCKELQMIAILEVHDITGKDNTSLLETAADYWIEVKEALIGKENYVILNIANEWVGTWDGQTWCDGYTSIIPKLRDAGIKNTIMVDAAGWGQYGQSITDFGGQVLDSDPDRNTMFSVHMYGTAGKNKSTIARNLKLSTDKGLCLIVGEFGWNHSDGDVDEEYILEYCNENGIGWLAWSWKGNGGGVEYLDLANEWDGSVLSDWGETVVNSDLGLKKTSVKCTVFD